MICLNDFAFRGNDKKDSKCKDCYAKHHFLYIHGHLKVKPKRKWTDKEIELVQAYYSSSSKEKKKQLKVQFLKTGRSWRCACAKASELGITKKSISD